MALRVTASGRMASSPPLLTFALPSAPRSRLPPFQRGALRTTRTFTATSKQRLHTSTPLFTMPSPPTIDRAAVTGFHNGALYDAHRPSYPPEVVDGLLTELGIAGRQGARVVEVAAGTGKFTVPLAARPEGFEIRAVEPLASMRDQLAAKGISNVEVLEGSATSLPVEDGWGDAVIVAQAFHWFANVEALAQLKRVIKPGSSLALLWNIEDYNKPASWKAATPWEQKLNELIFSLKLDGQPRFRDERWKDVFLDKTGDNGKVKELFVTPIGEKVFPWTVWLSDEALLLRLRTLSQVAILQGKDKEDFDSKFWDIVKSPEAERNEQGLLPLHGGTTVAWTRRVD